METFEQLIHNIIKEGKRDLVFDYLIAYYSEGNEINVASDTNLLVFSTRFQSFFDDTIVTDSPFEKKTFLNALSAVKERLHEKGELYYDKLFVLLKLLVEEENQQPEKTVIDFLRKLYKDYNY